MERQRALTVGALLRSDASRAPGFGSRPPRRTQRTPPPATPLPGPPRRRPEDVLLRGQLLEDHCAAQRPHLAAAGRNKIQSTPSLRARALRLRVACGGGGSDTLAVGRAQEIRVKDLCAATWATSSGKRAISHPKLRHVCACPDFGVCPGIQKFRTLGGGDVRECDNEIRLGTPCRRAQSCP